MSRIILTLTLTVVLFTAQAQYWSATNLSGNISINGTTTSTDYDDISISRNKPGTGMKIFNTSLTGRSIIVMGQGYGGKYGFLVHNAESYNAGAGYTLTYRPSSTVLAGSDVNGLALVSTSEIRFTTGGDVDGNLRMTLDPSGNLGIGTNDTKGYKLAVKGKVVAEEVVVKLYGSWPDYVFESDYKMPSLFELNAYILQNKHLPEIPSAVQVEKDGINTGEMNLLLLKKVEELTLYVIQQQKEIEALKSKVNSGR